MIQMLLALFLWLAFKWLLFDEDGSAPLGGRKAAGPAPRRPEIGTSSTSYAQSSWPGSGSGPNLL